MIDILLLLLTWLFTVVLTLVFLAGARRVSGPDFVADETVRPRDRDVCQMVRREVSASR